MTRRRRRAAARAATAADHDRRARRVEAPGRGRGVRRSRRRQDRPSRSLQQSDARKRPAAVAQSDSRTRAGCRSGVDALEPASRVSASPRWRRDRLLERCWRCRRGGTDAGRAAPRAPACGSPPAAPTPAGCRRRCRRRAAADPRRAGRSCGRTADWRTARSRAPARGTAAQPIARETPARPLAPRRSIGPRGGGARNFMKGLEVVDRRQRACADRARLRDQASDRRAASAPRVTPIASSCGNNSLVMPISLR